MRRCLCPRGAPRILNGILCARGTQGCTVAGAREWQPASRYYHTTPPRLSNGAGNVIAASSAAKRTFNPIRKVVDRMQVKPNKDLDLIPLSIGDPTVYGNFRLPDFAGKVLSDIGSAMSHNGYPNSVGYQDARAAIAERFGGNAHPISADDVILTCGASQALDLAISVLCEPGRQNILLPRPGFSLYVTLCGSKGIAYKFYDLDPARGWECDIASIESKIDSETAAILVNNPSNPCGSVFSKEHMREIVALAEKHKIPLIADEIYADMAFPSSPGYYSFDTMSREVPILSVGGLAKQYMIPGWRMGWITIHDRQGQFSEVKQGLQELSTLTLGPSSILQAMVRPLLFDTPKEYYAEVLGNLEKAKFILMEGLKDIKTLQIVEPQGAMYMMVKVDAPALGFKNDVDFSKALLSEESVFVLPGESFGAPSFFRVVITPPEPKLREACVRIQRFCEKHAVRT